MDDQVHEIPASNEVLHVLRKIEEHLAALRSDADGTADEWLTLDEVAEELRVSRDTIERMIAAGKLRAAEVSTSAGGGARRRYRVRRAWIDASLAGLARPPEKTGRARRRSRTPRTDVDFIG